MFRVVELKLRILFKIKAGPSSLKTKNYLWKYFSSKQRNLINYLYSARFYLTIINEYQEGLNIKTQEGFKQTNTQGLPRRQGQAQKSQIRRPFPPQSRVRRTLKKSPQNFQNESRWVSELFEEECEQGGSIKEFIKINWINYRFVRENCY